MTSNADLKAWLPHARDLAQDGVGFLALKTDTELLDRPGLADLLESVNGAFYLGHLTEALLGDREATTSLLRNACSARRDGGVLFASTPLPISLLYGSEVDAAEPWELNVPALVARSELAYLLETACVTSLVSGATGVAFLTPIEERMASALEEAGIAARAQVEVGTRRVDFLIEDSVTGRQLAVECDGAGFHDPAEDAARDRELEEVGIETVRFSGSTIFRDAAACASRIKELIKEGPAQPLGTAGAGASLSSVQLRAASHREGPARVAAPAGSGKTRVVEQRITSLVARGVEPSRICAISFTNAAVNEMRQRLDGLECRFTTVHSLAKAVAEERFGSKTLVQNISPDHSRTIPSRWKLLRSLLSSEELYMSRPREFWVDAINSYRQSFEIPRFDDWDTEQVPTHERFLEICGAYDRCLLDRRLTDFEGFIHDALRALASDANYRSLWAGKFDYWIVDEYQDLPLAKLWLLRLLAAPARNLFVVGDDDQVIFEFAGASGSIFSGFSEHFPDAREFLLDRNYRSPHDLVVRSGWMIARNRTRVEKDTKPNQPLEAVDRVTLSREPAYDLAGLDFVQDLIDEGRSPEDIAVLFRLRDMAIPLERLLQEAQIPFRRCARPSFYDTRPVKALQAWLRLTCGQVIRASDVNLTLEWPPRYISRAQRDNLVRMVSGSKDPRSMAQAAINVATKGFNRTGQRAVTHWAQAVLRGDPSHSPAQCLDTLKLRDVVKNDKAPMGRANPVVTYDVFYRIAAQFDTTDELLAWIARNSDDVDYDLSPDQNHETTQGLVALASIHEAKGKEWDHVAVLGPLDGMPDGRAQTPTRQEEERRIAYVAFTRARKSILFGSSLRYARELDQREDGLTWEDYRQGRTEPSGAKSSSDSESNWNPWEGQRRTAPPRQRRRSSDDSDGPLADTGHAMKGGVAVIRPGQPAVDGEVLCSCGARLFRDDRQPIICPECGSSEPQDVPG